MAHQFSESGDLRDECAKPCTETSSGVGRGMNSVHHNPRRTRFQPSKDVRALLARARIRKVVTPIDLCARKSTLTDGELGLARLRGDVFHHRSSRSHSALSYPR